MRDLRAEQEGGFYQSPNLASGAIFSPPRLDEVPEAPEWRGADGGRTPHPDDHSEKAESYRSLAASRAEALRWRARVAAQRRRAPHNIWGALRGGGERGGLRPGQRAYPAAWERYLLRADPDGPAGDGWGSPLGVALRRVERAYADTPLWRALWAYTEPRAREPLAAAQVALGRSRAQTYRWLDAAARRLAAETRAQLLGRRYAGDELRHAEATEALAWLTEPTEPTGLADGATSNVNLV